jgi:hypothetical protein
MATKNIIKLLEKGNVAKDLKVAYSFMLLSRGYSADEIKALDDYDFLIRKKNSKTIGETNQIDVATPKNRKQRSLPKNPVCLTSTSDAYNNRDHTLYSLNGESPVTKGRLVWSIIKLYQEQHNPTYEEVSQLFNRKLNLLGNTVVNELSLDALRPDRQKRFYYHESDLLVSKDDIKYAVSNQWSVDKMDKIISFARSIGCEIELINPL